MDSFSFSTVWLPDSRLTAETVDVVAAGRCVGTRTTVVLSWTPRAAIVKVDSMVAVLRF